MKRYTYVRSLFLGASVAVLTVASAHAESFNIPGGDLDSALDAYTTQSGVAVIVSNAAVKGAKTPVT